MFMFMPLSPSPLSWSLNSEPPTRCMSLFRLCSTPKKHTSSFLFPVVGVGGHCHHGAVRALQDDRGEIYSESCCCFFFFLHSFHLKALSSNGSRFDVTLISFFVPKQEVLKQLQGTIEEESGEASGSQLELIERLKGTLRVLCVYSSCTLRVLFVYSACNICVLSGSPAEMSLDSAGYKPRMRPPLPPSSSSSSASSSSGAPMGAAGGSGAPGPSMAAAFPRRGLPSAGRDGHDRCLEELEKERYYGQYNITYC